MKCRFYTAFFRGVHANSNIKHGECCLFIPISRMITPDKGYATPLGKIIEEKKIWQNLNNSNHVVLATYLLQEWEKAESERKFEPYLDILPKSCYNFPIMFKEDELALLKGSPVLR